MIYEPQDPKNGSILITAEDGRTLQCDILLTFLNETTGNHYIVYTDHSKQENGTVNVYASIYDPTGQDRRLLPVETDEEWSVIEEILNQITAFGQGDDEQ